MTSDFEIFSGFFTLQYQNHGKEHVQQLMSSRKAPNPVVTVSSISVLIKEAVEPSFVLTFLIKFRNLIVKVN